MHGGLIREKLPDVQALNREEQAASWIEHVGDGTFVIQPVLRNEGNAVCLVVIVATGIPLGGMITVCTVDDGAPEKARNVVKEVRSPHVAFARGWPSQSLKVSNTVEVKLDNGLFDAGKIVVVDLRHLSDDVDHASHAAQH